MNQESLNKAIRVVSFFSIIILFTILLYTIRMYIINTNVSSKDIRDAENLFSQAVDSFNNSKYESSIKLLKKAIKLNPNESKYYLKIADIYEIKNRYDIEINFLTSINQNLFKRKDIQLRVGRAYCLNGDYDDCINTLDEMFDIDNISYESFLLIDAFLKTGKFNEAYTLLKDFNQCDVNYGADLILIKYILQFEMEGGVINVVECSSYSNNYFINQLTDLTKSFDELKDNRNVLLLKIANLSLGINYPKLTLFVLGSADESIKSTWEYNYLTGVSYFLLSDFTKSENYINLAESINVYEYRPIWIKARLNEATKDIDNAISIYKEAIIKAGDDAGPIYWDYISFLDDCNLENLLLSTYAEASKFFLRINNYKDFIKLSLQFIEYALNKQDFSKAEIIINSIDSLGDSVVEDSGYKDEFLIYKFKYLVDQQKINEAMYFVQNDLFEDPLFKDYCKAVLFFYQSKYNEANILFREILDSDINGFLTQNVLKYSVQVN